MNECTGNWTPLDFGRLTLDSLSLHVNSASYPEVMDSLRTLDASKVGLLRIEFFLRGDLGNRANRNFLAWMRDGFTKWVQGHYRQGLVGGIEVVFTALVAFPGPNTNSAQSMSLGGLVRRCMGKILDGGQRISKRSIKLPATVRSRTSGVVVTIAM